MGFSVTASHLILLVTGLAAGAVFTGAALHATDAVEEGQREAWRAADDLVHSNLSVLRSDGYPTYDAAQQRFKVKIQNNGTTVLEVDEITFVIDGSLVASGTIEQRSVSGAGTTNLLLPREVLEVWFKPVTPSPTKLKAVAANGAAAYWRP